MIYHLSQERTQKTLGNLSVATPFDIAHSIAYLHAKNDEKSLTTMYCLVASSYSVRAEEPLAAAKNHLLEHADLAQRLLDYEFEEPGLTHMLDPKCNGEIADWVRSLL
jgi:hypothetical protein